MSLICNIPFNTITYAPKGHQACCLHNFKVHEGLSDEEFWNCEEMTTIRNGFLKGNPVGQCKQCVEFVNSLSGNKGLPPPGFWFVDKDNVHTQTHVYSNFITDDHLQVDSKLDPVVAVLNVSNKCNLACRTCSPFLSDTQAAFRRKAGIENNDRLYRKDVLEYINSVNNFKNLKEALMVGGEPMMDSGFTEVLKKLRKDICMKVQCNGTLSNKEFLDELMKFEKCSLMFSIDSGKEINEYLRTNVDQEKWWSTVKESIKYCLERRPDMKFKITSTMSNISAFGIRELGEEIESNLGLDVFENGIFSFSYITVTYPEYFRPYNLDKDSRKNLLLKLKSDRDWMIKRDRELYDILVSACEGVAKLLHTFDYDEEQYQKFLDFNSRYDKLLGSNLSSIIPIKVIE